MNARRPEEDISVFEAYKKQMPKILRSGRDIEFTDIRYQIESIVNFMIDYYGNEKYYQRFNDNEHQDIRHYVTTPIRSALDDILGRVNWSTQIADQRRSEIMGAFQRLKETNYITRLEAAKGADDERLNRLYEEFKVKNDEVIAEQQAVLSAAKNASEELYKELEEQRVSLDKSIKAIEKRAEKSAKSLAKQISSTEGKVFQDRAKNYAGVAKNWLVVMMLIAIVGAFLFGYLFIDLLQSPEKILDNYIISGVKISALILVIYIIQIANRNYNANKHLQTINDQRASTLAFINEFQNTIDAVEYKDYLLTYAAKTIFDHGETGFISRQYGAGSSEDSGLDSLLNNISRHRQ